MRVAKSDTLCETLEKDKSWKLFSETIWKSSLEWDESR